MRFGIFSDIHSNFEALEAVLTFLRAEGATKFLCCGDIVGYGPDPALCIQVIKSLRGPVVAGNHDYGVLGRTPGSEFNPAAREALTWTRGQLSESEVAWLDSLPLTELLEPFHMVHSSPSAPGQWEYVFSVRDAEEEMDSFSTRVCLVGHTHYPFAVERREGSQARAVRDGGIAVHPDAKYVVNVGSVGQPRDGDPRACCVTYDSDSRELAFHRVAYEVQVVQEKMRDAGLPSFLADRLTTGR